MRITMNYFAQVRQAAGVETELVELSAGIDVAGAIGDAARRHGDAFRVLALDAGGKVRPSLLVLVNGVPVSREVVTLLKDGAVVSLMSAVAGG